MSRGKYVKLAYSLVYSSPNFGGPTNYEILGTYKYSALPHHRGETDTTHTISEVNLSYPKSSTVRLFSES